MPRRGCGMDGRVCARMGRTVCRTRRSRRTRGVARRQRGSRHRHPAHRPAAPGPGWLAEPARPRPESREGGPGCHGLPQSLGAGTGRHHRSPAQTGRALADARAAARNRPPRRPRRRRTHPSGDRRAATGRAARSRAPLASRRRARHKPEQTRGRSGRDGVNAEPEPRPQRSRGRTEASPTSPTGDRLCPAFGNKPTPSAGIRR